VTHSLSTLALLTGTAFVAVFILALRAQKELNAYIQELEFFLKQRIVNSNQAKARLAVSQTRAATFEDENNQLRVELSQALQEVRTLKGQETKMTANDWKAAGESFQIKGGQKDSNDTDQADTYNKDFVLEQATQIQKLEFEVSSIQKLLSQDIKAQITEYMNEVDGLTEKLKSARKHTSTSA